MGRGLTPGRLKEDSGKTPGRLWEDSRKTPERLQEDSGKTPEDSRRIPQEDSGLQEDSGKIPGGFREGSGGFREGSARFWEGPHELEMSVAHQRLWGCHRHELEMSPLYIPIIYVHNIGIPPMVYKTHTHTHGI